MRTKNDWWGSRGSVMWDSLTRGHQRVTSDTISALMTHRINLTYVANGPEQNQQFYDSF